jgi:hypothetical protein
MAIEPISAVGSTPFVPAIDRLQPLRSDLAPIVPLAGTARIDTEQPRTLAR